MPLQNRILVIRGGAIGDFVLTLPVLAALRQQFPGSRLELLGYPHIAQLALAGGLVDAVRSIEARPMAGFFVPGGTPAAEWASYFGGFALIISYLYDPDFIFQTNVALCSRAQFIAGPHRPDDAGAIHATEALLRPLQRLAIFDADPVPRLALVPSASRRASLLALHPGSGSERKNWPEARWAELLERLAAETPWDILLVGGEAEGDRLERLARLFPSPRLNIARHRPLPELAARLQGCSAFLGHDSGITHLAAALGLPGLALWGDSVEAVWHPRGEHLKVVRSACGLEGISVQQVLEELGTLAVPAG